MAKKLIYGKYPMLFYQEGRLSGASNFWSGQRIRIIYPDGTAEWHGSFTNDSHVSLKFLFYQAEYKRTPCWLVDRLTAVSQKEAISLMKKYDATQRYPKAVFIGYIK